MDNLITFSVNPDFIELEKRIQMIYKTEDYKNRLSETVELLEEISKTTATDAMVYSAGLAEQMTMLGNVMAVYTMSKIWDVQIYGLQDIQSKNSVIIDTLDEYGITFLRHPINAEKVHWLIEYESNRP